MEKLAVLSFQSNDHSDVFLQAELFQDNVCESDESSMGIEDTQFNADQPCVNGKRQEMIPVHVAGDTIFIRVWIKNYMLSYPYTMTIYVEYEEVDTAEFFTNENESL